jgi:hypothetical protein
MRNAKGRLARLEAAINPRCRKFGLFDRSNYDPKFDLTSAVQRLRDEHATTDNDEIHIFRWLGSNDAPHQQGPS